MIIPVRHVKGTFQLTELARNFLLESSPYSWVAILYGIGAAPEHVKLKEGSFDSLVVIFTL